MSQQSNVVKKMANKVGVLMVKTGIGLKKWAKKPKAPEPKIIDDFRDDEEYQQMAKTWLNIVKNHKRG